MNAGQLTKKTNLVQSSIMCSSLDGEKIKYLIALEKESSEEIEDDSD